MSTHFATLGRCLSLLLLSASLARAQSCYIANGEAAPSDVVPCGDTSGGTVWSCCQLGDTCLEDSACFNTPSQVTYLYGCSDSSYSSSVCPYKCGFDSIYVGLSYCDTNGTSNLWTCTHPDSDTATQVTANSNGDRQECLADSYIAFGGPNSLPAVLNLPADAGGSTTYYSTYSYTGSDGGVTTTYTPVDGYTPNPLPTPVTPASKPNAPQQVAPAPTTTTTPSRTTPSTTPSRTTTPQKTTTPSLTTTSPTTTSPTPEPTTTPSTTTPSQTSSSPSTTLISSTIPQSSTFSTSTSSSAATSSVAAVHSSSGLSTSAKAGIGGGLAGAAIAAAAVAFFLICLRRRRRSHEPVPQNEVPYTPSPYTPQTPYSPNSEKRYTDHPTGIPPVMGLGVAGGAMMAEAGSHPHDNRRSELPAAVPQRFSNNGNHSELDSYTRFASPTPTYSTWENTNSWSHSPTQGSYDPTVVGSRPPGHDAIHELH